NNMLGGADNPNGELPSYITGADSFARESARKRNDTRDKVALVRTGVNIGQRIFVFLQLSTYTAARSNK
ncbi:hypothetical protein ACF1YR_005027, partial [Escherichia coli]